MLKHLKPAPMPKKINAEEVILQKLKDKADLLKNKIKT